MALSIRNRETERLAREVAKLTGEGLTETVHKALAQRLEREQRALDNARSRRRQKLLHIIERAASRPILDQRSEDEILGYDDRGIPA